MKLEVGKGWIWKGLQGYCEDFVYILNVMVGRAVGGGGMGI